MAEHKSNFNLALFSTVTPVCSLYNAHQKGFPFHHDMENSLIPKHLLNLSHVYV